MLRTLDRRRQVFRLPGSRTDMGAAATRQCVAVPAKTDPVDLEPTGVALICSGQRREKAFCCGPNQSWRTDALRGRVWVVCALPGWLFSRIPRVLERWSVGCVCFLSRRFVMAKQGGRNRAFTAELPAELRDDAALVTGR